VDGDPGGAGLPVAGDEIVHLEGGGAGGPDHDGDVDDVVETQRAAVLQRCLHHREFDPFGPEPVVGPVESPQVLDPRLLQVGQVGGVVDHSHGVGLTEPHPQPVGERIGARVGRGIEPHPHRLRR
jgi:hypothetical protein